jgi:formate hydrogenlyase subunit 3/multisubunit Na+/H+ antiporter MnhD subunit
MLKSFSMTHNDNSIGGSIASIGTYILSINQVNSYMTLIFGLLSGASSIYTIINIYQSKKKKNEKS